jgi:hypothetical protein
MHARLCSDRAPRYLRILSKSCRPKRKQAKMRSVAERPFLRSVTTNRVSALGQCCAFGKPKGHGEPGMSRAV